jgi:branched-chain amino acid transport system permease protein
MRKSLVICLTILAVGALMPIVAGNEYFLHILILMGIFSTLACYWNMLDGYMGVIHFGYAAFFGLGAYTSAILSTKLSLPILFTIPLAGLMSAIVGGLVIIPCLRMGTYATAIVTLAFGEIMRIIASSWISLTKGEMGFWGIPAIFEGANREPFVYLISVILAGAIFALSLIIRSTTGLAFVAIKDDEVAASTTGIPVYGLKLFGTIISCFVAGIVGAFYAHYILTITPAIFGIAYTIQIMAMSLFGGKATLLGPLAGAIVLIFLGESFRFLENYRMIIYGLVIIGTVMLFPEGLSGIAKQAGRGFLTRWSR